MSKFSFIEELTEARVFRRLSDVGHLTVDKAGVIALNYFYTLLILWHEDRKTAIKYAKDVVSSPNFPEFKPSQPDLYNVLVMLLHQEQYFGKQTTYTLPELRIRRVMRDMANGRVDERDFYQLLLILMRTTQGMTDMHQRLRRQMHNYDDISVFDKVRNTRHLVMALRKDVSIYPDLHAPLQAVLHKLT